MIRKAEFLPLLKNDYPTSDGRPMAETDFHRILMTELIETLMDHYAANPNVYVSGNLLLFYEEGNKRRHVSPDVMVVFGVPKEPRLNYRVWVEGKAPSVVIELTSSSTRKEDRTKKWVLYRDVLKVPEYFLFDPFGDYLKPRFQGFRLVKGEYKAFRSTNGRMKSQKLGLILEQDGDKLRLFNPGTGQRLMTREELVQTTRADSQELVDAKAEIVRLRKMLAQRERNGNSQH